MWVCNPFPVSHWFLRRVASVCVVPRVFVEMFPSLGRGQRCPCPHSTPRHKRVSRAFPVQSGANFSRGLGPEISACLPLSKSMYVFPLHLNKPGFQTLFCIRLIRCLLKCSFQSTISRVNGFRKYKVHPSSFLTSAPRRWMQVILTLGLENYYSV